MTSTTDDSSGSAFGKTLVVVTKLPGVRIDRTSYLQRSLARRCPEDQVRQAIAESPAAAGISLAVLGEIADASIRHESARVTALSAAAGLPGGLAMLGTIPADSAQYLAHMLRVAQKLAYLYSWPELFDEEGVEPDDGTQNVLRLFIGAMFGVQAANKGLAVIASRIAEQTIRQLPRRALTHGVVYPIVKKVASMLGVRMTRGIFAKGVSKAVPIIGGFVSGGLTLTTFLPMAKRLKQHLAGLDTAKNGL